MTDRRRLLQWNPKEHAQPMSFDNTGKISLKEIYSQPDPRAYFSTLRELDYCIPQLAKPYFLKLFQAYRETHGRPPNQVVDIGCSYGINAALLKCNATMDELYERYCKQLATCSRSQLVEHDRQLVQRRNHVPDTRFLGLDVAEAALTYATEAGLLDDAVTANLETGPMSAEVQNQLKGTDLVMSTGCIGYVTVKTLRRVLEASGERQPWMAHFVLRMFPFEPVDELLKEHGYETQLVKHLFKQRRFSSSQEQTQIFDTLASVGLDPTGVESDGWLYAQLYISRPRDSARHPISAPLCD